MESRVEPLGGVQKSTQDQSLRAWLCGGDILRAKSSHVAHMWRVDSDPRTLSHYKLRHHTDNLARVAAIWFGEFKDKFREGKLDAGLNVSAAAQKLENLKCKPFAFFLHRFRKLYVAGGVLPENVFRLRLKGTDKCISKGGSQFRAHACSGASWFHFANMAPAGFPHPSDFQATGAPAARSSEVVCGGHRARSCAECPQNHGEEPGLLTGCPSGLQLAGFLESSLCIYIHIYTCIYIYIVHIHIYFSYRVFVMLGLTVELLGGAQKSAKEWCHVDCKWVFGQCVPASSEPLASPNMSRAFSGIRLWNSIECFDRLDPTGPIVYFCDITGQNQNQQYLLDSQGLIRHSSGRCVSVNAKATQLTATPCEAARQWEVVEGFVPAETLRYQAAVARYGLREDSPDS